MSAPTPGVLLSVSQVGAFLIGPEVGNSGGYVIVEDETLSNSIRAASNE